MANNVNLSESIGKNWSCAHLLTNSYKTLNQKEKKQTKHKRICTTICLME